MIISSINAKIVKDSRNKDTVEASVNGQSAKCPSGASRGRHEAKTIDAKKAVQAIKKISKNFFGKEFEQKQFDSMLIKLAGKNKSRLGANVTTPLSMAFCRAAAEENDKELHEFIAETYGENSAIPIPMMNVINGGAHAKGKLTMQEFMLVPIKFGSFESAFEACTTIYAKLRDIIKEFYGNIVLGDEGGFSPPIAITEHALNLIDEALKRTGHEDKVKIGLDAAASQFFKNGKYHIDGKKLSGKEMQDYYLKLIEKYPIISIEDPFHEEDWKNFAEFTKRTENKVMVVGDDLTATNTQRIRVAASKKACNLLILKVNQIGTVTEALEAAKLAGKHKWNIIVSHRSGETTDSFIADLAVGIGAAFIKSGAPHTPFRLAKYHRLIEIEGKTGIGYAGKNFRI